MLTGLRSRDLVARYAGDEFVVLLDAVNNRQDAEKVRSNIEQLLGAPLQSIDSMHRGDGRFRRSGDVSEDGDIESLIRHSDADINGGNNLPLLYVQ